MKTRLTINDCRPEVLAFAVLMELKLRYNDHKEPWAGLGIVELKRLMAIEVEELDDASDGDPDDDSDNIALEAADVANFAMMIADNCGGLK